MNGSCLRKLLQRLNEIMHEERAQDLVHSRCSVEVSYN